LAGSDEGAHGTFLVREFGDQQHIPFTHQIAPDLLISERANVFWRRCRQGDITPAEAMESVADLVTLNIPLVPATSLVQSALQLALQHQRTVYDALYLALAQERVPLFLCGAPKACSPS
jgi:predicted nucleic acid-binding protein